MNQKLSATGILLFLLVASAAGRMGSAKHVSAGQEFDSWPVEHVEVGGSRLIEYGHTSPLTDPKTSADWPVHSLNVANRQFSTLRQINTSTIASLVPRWMFQTGLIAGYSFENTPVVEGGLMYVTDSHGNVYALDAVTGQRVWTFLIGGSIFGTANRGVAYGDGYVYVAAGTSVYALDAKTGEPLRSFGDDGKAGVIREALQNRFPDVVEPHVLGYSFTMAPQYYAGKVFVSTSVSDMNIPSGILMAIDAKTGKVLWKFDSVPQGPQDEGWDVAGPTWVGGARNGGGVWGTPAIDPALGMLYIAVGNPSPEHDGSARIGTNLFTASVVALEINTGKLKWHFQQVHHDIWNSDSACEPILFDMQIGGKTVKALAQAQKNGYLYILNRETGHPVHSVEEVPVPTATDVPGEHPWPTQPIPLKADGKRMRSFIPTYPEGLPADWISKAVPYMTPVPASHFTIGIPSARGGANFGPCSYSPETGLIYVSALDDPIPSQTKPVGNSLRPGEPSGSASNRLPGPRSPRGTLTAYDPTTGELVWLVKFPGWEQGGSMVTAGGVVFAGDSSGVFHAFEAAGGKELWRFNAGSGIHGSPMTYQLNGEQYISVASGGRPIAGTPGGDLVITFALPRRE